MNAVPMVTRCLARQWAALTPSEQGAELAMQAGVIKAVGRGVARLNNTRYVAASCVCFRSASFQPWLSLKEDG